MAKNRANPQIQPTRCPINRRNHNMMMAMGDKAESCSGEHASDSLLLDECTSRPQHRCLAPALAEVIALSIQQQDGGGCTIAPSGWQLSVSPCGPGSPLLPWTAAAPAKRKSGCETTPLPEVWRLASKRRRSAPPALERLCATPKVRARMGRGVDISRKAVAPVCLRARSAARTLIRPPQ